MVYLKAEAWRPIEALLCNPSKRVADGLWQLDVHEILVGIEIIFAGFIHAANQIVLSRKCIIDDTIQFS